MFSEKGRRIKLDKGRRATLGGMEDKAILYFYTSSVFLLIFNDSYAPFIY